MYTYYLTFYLLYMEKKSGYDILFAYYKEISCYIFRNT